MALATRLPSQESDGDDAPPNSNAGDKVQGDAIALLWVVTLQELLTKLKINRKNVKSV